MNVLFLTLVSIEDINEQGIYHDLIKEFRNRNVNIFVLCPRERRMGLETELFEDDCIKILKVKTGNITKTNVIEKGITTLTIERVFLNAVKKYFKKVKFDMIIYSTPPSTFYKIINFFKKKDNAISYLMLKDIFPQNAVDIGLIKKASFLYKYFRKKEEKLYDISDFIGCMSPKNCEYVLKNNHIAKEKIEVFPNSIKISDFSTATDYSDIYQRYSIPKDKILFLYGGNLGKPQGIAFLIDIIDNFEKLENSFLLIVGSGTEYGKIENHILTHKICNTKLISFLPKKDYDSILKKADVGLIFLDKRFTIPNFPSRLTAYMDYALPILAATDKSTDLKETLEHSECGFWCESGDTEAFMKYVEILSKDKEKRVKMGKNGRKYLEKNYNIEKNIDILLKHLYKTEA
jgi:glycosyltransferase involved in cell wall biosynthesis